LRLRSIAFVSGFIATLRRKLAAATSRNTHAEFITNVVGVGCDAGTSHESIQPSVRFVHYDFVRFDFVALRRRPAAGHHAILTRNLLRKLFPYPRCVVSIIPWMPAMMLDLFEGESNMIKKLLGAAAMAAVVFAVVPASAAKMVGCSGDNLMKVETAVEALPDGEIKNVGFKEITAAQAAMLDGHMAQCGEHLNRAAHAGMMK
jgi:hypothetical protein